MIKTKIYENGLKLVVEKMTGFESVAFNMFVGVGSVDEQKGEYGISHFLEHMHFKGTKTKNAFELTKAFNAIGAKINAYTNFEETDYYTKSSAENAEKCVELMSDMLFNSTFDKTEMEREKNVVIEEIKMYDDDPQSKVTTLVNSKFYDSTPFARDISGTIGSVKSFSQNRLFDYKKRFYVPNNITLSFAGNINFETAEKYVKKYFLPYFENNNKTVKKQVFKPSKKVTYAKAFKDNEQSQVCISFPGLYRDDDTIYTAKVFNYIFGNGMSSILFQSVREKLGLVYSISSSIYQNNAGGDFTIDFATSNKNVPKALKEVKHQIELVTKNGVSQEQFLDAKNSYISSVKMSYENTSFVSLFNAKRFSILGSTLSKEDHVKNIEKVTYEDVQKYVKTLFSKKHFSVAVVGKEKNLKINKYF